MFLCEYLRHKMKVISSLSLLKILIFSASFQTNTCSEESSVHHRVRRFVFTKNSKVSFDIELMIPIPSLGGVDVEVNLEFPLSITMLNDTIIFNPITVPYVVLPEAAVNYPANPVNYPSYIPNYYSYDSYYGSQGGSPYYSHQAMKRSIGAASALHRYDLFNSIAETLERYGIDGRNCIYKAVCELAHTPMLIESPLHEILEHILIVSRAYDEEGLLQDFTEAEKYGKSGKNCSKKYNSCSFSIFEKLNN